MTEQDQGNNRDNHLNENTSGASYNNVFNRIEKFDGKNDTDFASWLRTFERACTISQKRDDLVKGQLLMLCVTGQALAVAEQLEEEKKAQQSFTELKARLESVFNTTASKESKMVEFENRIQRVEEGDDEFMLSLVKLYRASNPDASDVVSTLAIKRKFMNGISPELRHSIYIFCNEPYAADVTHQNLLEHARKARLQLTQRESETSSLLHLSSIATLSKNQQEESNTKAISNLEGILASVSI